MLLGKYKLIKDLPGLKSGVVFEHRSYDCNFPDRGNPACGVMILGWLDGDCQGGWCGETYIMPGQLSKDSSWFERICCEENLIGQIRELSQRVIELEEKLKSSRLP